jgi:hypothetical protein
VANAVGIETEAVKDAFLAVPVDLGEDVAAVRVADRVVAHRADRGEDRRGDREEPATLPETSG